MKIRPLHDRLIVKRTEERKTASGIVIPENAGEKPQRGIIQAAGPGKLTADGKLQPMAVKVGDQVLFGKYSGTEVKIGTEDLLVMKEEDIMGIIEG
ncbi:MAG: co-chaperone GroES [Gammaproteobacteria bacterium]